MQLMLLRRANVSKNAPGHMIWRYLHATTR